MKKHLILSILSLSAFSIHADGVNLTCAPYQPLCVNCPEYQTLFPLETLSDNSETLDVEADNSEIIENQYHFSGDVEIKSDSYFLAADDIEVSPSDNSSLAQGNVRFQDNAYLITSNLLSAKKEDGELIATATNANYQDFETGPGGANGYSEIISKTPTSVFLTNATYSLCPVNKNDWLVDAESIELNLDKNRGIADSATIVFYGVPIFYLPKYSWVLEGRGSGFLTPDFDNYKESSQTKRSFRLRVPYYINIAPDRDLLVALNYMSSRGMIYEGKYRQLIKPKITEEDEHSLWEIETQFLFDDKITNLNRWLIDTSIELDYSEKIHLSTRYYRVSDKKYFEEIARTNTNVNVLTSHLNLSYKDENELKVAILSEDEQVVNNGTDTYIRALEGSISKTFRIGKKKQELITARNIADSLVHSTKQRLEDLKDEISDEEKSTIEFSVNELEESIKGDDKDDIDAKVQNLREKTQILAQKAQEKANESNDLIATVLTEDEEVVNTRKPTTDLAVNFVSTKFDHNDSSKESGVRTHGKLNLSRQLASPHFPIITPNANISLTHYNLNNSSSNITRTIGGGGVNIDFSINNKTNLFGKEVNHRLSPIIQYSYRAKELQGNIPIFDSTDKYDDIITFADLTSGERYTGLDRITNANDITLSIESSHRDVNALDDDKDLLNMKIAQSYYTDDEVVSDTANTNYETRKSYSDIVASIDVAISNLTFGTAVQFDPDQSSIVKRTNSLSYILHPRKFVSMSVSDNAVKEDDGEKIAKFYGAYPVNESIHLFGGLDRTTSTGVTNSETTGIAYESCCWAFRIAHFKEKKSSGYDYSTGFELVLSGLGSTSTPLKNRIENKIPDYSANLRYKP